jgi:hypothetical protein
MTSCGKLATGEYAATTRWYVNLHGYGRGGRAGSTGAGMTT